MANINAPFGLRLVAKQPGTPYVGAVNPYFTPSTDSTALFMGDPVLAIAGANAAEFNGSDIGTLRNVTIASEGDTNPVTGAYVGLDTTNRDDAIYRAASTDEKVFCADDDRNLYEVQANGTATTAMIGLNAVLEAGAGDTITGMSGWTLDVTTVPPATTATFQVKIIRLAPIEGNTIADPFPIMQVRIINHAF